MISSETDLAADTYDVILNGLTDLAGNELPKDAKASATKAASIIKQFVAYTTEAPEGTTDGIDIYYTAVDQYGQAKEFIPTEATAVISVSASIPDSEYPLAATVTNSGTAKGCVNIKADKSLTAGKVIEINLTNKKTTGDTVDYEYSSTLSVTLKKGAKGTPVDVAKVTAAEELDAMTNSGTPEAPKFKLTSDATKNVFTISSVLADTFKYDVTENGTNQVKYVLDDSGVLAFDDSITPDENTGGKAYTASGDAKFKAIKAGTATVTAYLVADDTKSQKITVTILPPDLTGITVGSLGSGNINGKSYSATVTLTPANTGLTAADIKVLPGTGADALDGDITLTDEKDGIKVNIKAKANAKNNKITFKLYTGTYDAEKKTFSNGSIQSDDVTFESNPSQKVQSIDITPFADHAVLAGAEAETTDKVLNDYGEDISSSLVTEAESGKTGVFTVESCAGGKLKIKGVAEGTAPVTVSAESAESGTVNKSMDVTVEPAAYAKAITLGDAVEVISGDSDIKYIAISATNQYGQAYKLTKKMVGEANTAGDELKLTLKVGSLLTAKYYTKDAKEKSGYKEATADTDEVNAIGVVVTAGQDKESTEDITVSSAKTEAPFDPVKVSVTIKEKRKAAEMKFAKEALSALNNADAANQLVINDQYGDPIDVTSTNIKFDYKKGTEASTDVEAEAQEYASETKDYKVTAKASKAGTYTVTAYLDADGDNKLGEKDVVKAAFTLTAGSASSMIAKVTIDKVVTSDVDTTEKKYDLDKVDYVKAKDGSDETTLKFTYKAYDSEGKEISIGSSDLSESMKWSVADEKDVKSGDIDQTQNSIKVSFADSKTEGSLTVKLHYTPKGDDVKDSISVPVSCAAPKAKEGTYTVYKSTDDKKTEVLDTTVALEIEPVTFKVEATDQYGEVYEGATEDYYKVVSSDDEIAKAEAQADNTIVVTPGTESGTATIRIYATETEVYTFKVSVGDYKLTLAKDNIQCMGAVNCTTDTVQITSDGVVTCPFLAEYGGGGIFFYVNPSKEAVDISSYKKVVFEFAEITGLPEGGSRQLNLKMTKDDNSSFWDADKKQIEQYPAVKSDSKEVEFDISKETDLTSIYSLALVDLANPSKEKWTVKIKSITLKK